MANVLFNRLIKAGMAMTVPPLVVNQVLYTGEWICRITSTRVILPISRPDPSTAQFYCKRSKRVREEYQIKTSEVSGLGIACWKGAVRRRWLLFLPAETSTRRVEGTWIPSLSGTTAPGWRVLVAVCAAGSD